ncbi:MAG: hypothetical protein A2X20_04305 [Bacteroidetes bacterium GWE2_40_15]|nr:MAG: hypothetical protein A2X20_04305 [Bacteroidetes bacterium GWE2_40_15]
MAPREFDKNLKLISIVKCIFYAILEVMQEIALAGIYRGGFFDKAAFYSGTCLRIFHGLPRFSV